MGWAMRSQSLPDEPAATYEQDPRAQGSARQRLTTVSFGCHDDRHITHNQFVAVGAEPDAPYRGNEPQSLKRLSVYRVRMGFVKVLTVLVLLLILLITKGTNRNTVKVPDQYFFIKKKQKLRINIYFIFQNIKQYQCLNNNEYKTLLYLISFVSKSIKFKITLHSFHYIN